jgi:hypothetical protein
VDEPNGVGGFDGPPPTMGSMSSDYNFEVPGMNKSTSEAKELSGAIQGVVKSLSTFAQGVVPDSVLRALTKIAGGFSNVREEVTGLVSAVNGGQGLTSKGGTGNTSFPVAARSTVETKAPVSASADKETSSGGTPPPPTTGAFGGGKVSSGGSAHGGLTGAPPGGILPADSSAADSVNKTMEDGGGGGGFLTSLASKVPGLGTVIKGFEKGAEIYGAIAQAGVQYGYNRIEGATGNRNSMLAMAQALGPNATLMGTGANGSPMTIRAMAEGLASRRPVLGSFTDQLQTIMAGQSVGALMANTPGRNGFFESVRQMQTLTPGAAPGQMAGGLASYMQNTGSQKMGAYFGGGAFTMMGKGGQYKSLAEWAEGITEFFKQQRPGSDRGKQFTRDELLAQNFPGSNINAWFEMMGVPPEMVDYWWQFVMTKTTSGGSSPWSGDDLKQAVQTQRGSDLASLRLNNMTSSARREFLLGTQMYGLYGVREAADQRFNDVMAHTDLQFGQMMGQSNAGTLMSILPTPIADMLVPLMMQFIGSPIGGMASMLGHFFGNSDIVSDMGDPPVPIGDSVSGYGAYGGTGTTGLAPDLSKRVSAMLRANPNLRVSSGHRDEFLQGRLHSKGVGKVGPRGHSAHTKGWAVDIGPTSQLGWLQANAGKFGLQTAGSAGEPWHVQAAGTMPIGDWLGGVKSAVGTGWNALKSVGGAAIDFATFGATSMLNDGLDIFENFFGSWLEGGSASGIIDSAINLFSKLMLAPMSGMVQLLGGSGVGMDPTRLDALTREIGSGSSFSFIDLPSWSGFHAGPGTTGNDALFGDPYTPPTPRGRSGASIVQVKVDNIIIQGRSGSGGGIDTRHAAKVLVDEIEKALSEKASF